MLTTRNNHGTGVLGHNKSTIQNSDWKRPINLFREFDNSDDRTNHADIQWEPDYDKYLARSARRGQLNCLLTTVPKGWPTQFNSPLAWKGSQLISNSSNEDLFVHHLSAEEILEVRTAVKYFKESCCDISQMTKETFILPTLGKRLEALSSELYEGKGFFVLRGLDPKEFSAKENSLAFVGVSSHIAGKRGSQDSKGNMLKHIFDAKALGPVLENRHAIYTNVSQPFHSDVICDILGLYTINCAAEGGTLTIASVMQVYNELAATRPDLLHTLSAPDWVVDMFGADPPYLKQPLLFYENGKLILNFSRRTLTGSDASPRTSGLPPITEAQAEALDAVHFICEKYSLRSTMCPGDLRFINNLAILHSREGFRDDHNNNRHLMRLWLKNEELAWEMPLALKAAMARVFENEGGRERWTLEPAASQANDLANRDSCGNG